MLCLFKKCSKIITFNATILNSKKMEDSLIPGMEKVVFEVGRGVMVREALQAALYQVGQGCWGFGRLRFSLGCLGWLWLFVVQWNCLWLWFGVVGGVLLGFFGMVVVVVGLAVFGCCGWGLCMSRGMVVALKDTCAFMIYGFKK